MLYPISMEMKNKAIYAPYSKHLLSMILVTLIFTVFNSQKLGSS